MIGGTSIFKAASVANGSCGELLRCFWFGKGSKEFALRLLQLFELGAQARTKLVGHRIEAAISREAGGLRFLGCHEFDPTLKFSSKKAKIRIRNGDVVSFGKCLLTKLPFVAIYLSFGNQPNFENRNMSTIFRGADLRSERAQQVVQHMLGHASSAMTLNVYADLFNFSDGGVGDRFWTTR